MSGLKLRGVGLGFSAFFGVLQDDAAAMIIDERPFFDFVQGPKAAEAGQFVIEAAIADRRGLSGTVHFNHLT